MNGCQGEVCKDRLCFSRLGRQKKELKMYKRKLGEICAREFKAQMKGDE